MDRKTLLAVALSFLIFFGWQKLYLEPRMQHAPAVSQTLTQMNTPTGSNSLASTMTASSNASTTTTRSRPVAPPRQVPLALKHSQITLSESARGIANWSLLGYDVSLESVTHLPVGIEFAVDDPAYGYLADVQGRFLDPQGLHWIFEDANIKLERKIVLPQGGEVPTALPLEFTVEFKQKKPSTAFFSIAAANLEKDPDIQDRKLVYFTNQSLEKALLSDSLETKSVPTSTRFIGITNRYFLLALLGDGPSALLQGTPQGKRISLVYPVSSNKIQIPLRIYFGPKDLSVLRSVDPSLDHTVDFGFFTVVAYPILKLLKWLYSFLGNYGWSIIVLTLLLKIVTFPLTYKSMKSMKEMAKIQPLIQKLREKYADDKEALNREMMALMKTNGYNPVAGCFPILIQMPIFFALYQVLYNSIELLHSPFALWIHDLSLRDPFYVTPVLLTGTMYFQQKLSPNTATDPAQAKMLQFMPIMFGAFMVALPSGLTLYMLTNAIAGIAQQIFLNKKLDITKTNPKSPAPAHARARS